MRDMEFVALIALVNHETMLMNGENKTRERNGQAMAYGDNCASDNYYLLDKELKRRLSKVQP